MEPAPRERVVILYRCPQCEHVARHSATWAEATSRKKGVPTSLPCQPCGPGGHCDPLEAYIDNDGRLTTRAPIEKVWFRGQRTKGVRPWWRQA